jgi:hypothetical protein
MKLNRLFFSFSVGLAISGAFFWIPSATAFSVSALDDGLRTGEIVVIPEVEGEEFEFAEEGEESITVLYEVNRNELLRAFGEDPKKDPKKPTAKAKPFSAFEVSGGKPYGTGSALVYFPNFVTEASFSPVFRGPEGNTILPPEKGASGSTWKNKPTGGTMTSFAMRFRFLQGRLELGVRGYQFFQNKNTTPEYAKSISGVGYDAKLNLVEFNDLDDNYGGTKENLKIFVAVSGLKNSFTPTQVRIGLRFEIMGR